MTKYFVLILFFVLELCESHEKVKLSGVNVLTLHHDRRTNARRSTSIPQLQCVGGSANCKQKYLPSVVQCKNQGSDGYDVQWKCQAELDSNLKFGRIDVNCEGYDYPDDLYILKGSCGLSYTLDKKGSSSRSEKYGSESNGSNFVLVIGLLILAIIVIYYLFISPNNTRTPDNNPTCPDAPPPPGFRPEFTHPQQSPPGYDEIYRNKATRTERDNPTSDNTGFWTALAAGGALGYLFGSSRTGTQHNARHQTMYTDDVPFDSTYSTSYRRGGHRERDSDSGNEYRTATGYGGTSRR